MKLSTKILAGAFGLTLLAVPVSADFDFAGLYNQVQQQQSQLDNHETRITNNEGNIKALQDNTQTPPASDPVVVPEVAPVVSASIPTPTPVTPAPTPTPAPTTKTIVAVSNDAGNWYIVANDETGPPLFCTYTYDNGTTSSEYGFPAKGFQCQPVGTVVPL